MSSVNPMSRPIFIFLILIIATAAAAVGLPGLAERPMHGDEAVNAVKLGETIEGRGYEYDPHEYHGRGRTSPSIAAQGALVWRARRCMPGALE